VRTGGAAGAGGGGRRRAQVQVVVGAATVRAGSATAAGQAQGHARRLEMITAMHHRRRGAARIKGRRWGRRLLPAQAVVVAEGGGWAAYIPGLPVHGDADTLDAAIDDLIDGLREYAEDWNDHLHTAPNHAGHRSLVELVELSDDEQLRDWLLGRTHPAGIGQLIPA
jgi:hypothetical protein